MDQEIRELYLKMKWHAFYGPQCITVNARIEAPGVELDPRLLLVRPRYSAFYQSHQTMTPCPSNDTADM